jgi:hypothetical protein
MQDDISSTPLGQICLLVLAGVAVHVIFLSLNLGATAALRLSIKDFKAVLIMASQKTLPISVAIIAFLPADRFGSQGLLTIPCILGHVSQLFIDAVIVSRMAAAEESRLRAEEEERHKDSDNCYTLTSSSEVRANGDTSIKSRPDQLSTVEVAVSRELSEEALGADR